jgi:putative lipoic acid-binding regulatory protein
MDLKPQQEDIADAVLANVRENFGIDFYDLMTKKIAHDYLNDKVDDVHAAIIMYPSIFERTLIGLVGPLSEDVLVRVCEKVQLDLKLEDSVRYSRIGDFAKYVESVSG